MISKQSLINKIQETNESVAEKDLYTLSSLIMPNIFWHELFVTISGKLGWKVLVVDDVLSSREQETFPQSHLIETAKSLNFKGSELLR